MKKSSAVISIFATELTDGRTRGTRRNAHITSNFSKKYQSREYNTMSGTALSIIGNVVAGFFGGGLAFIATLLKRRWERKDRDDKTAKAINELGAQISDTNKKIATMQTSIMEELAKDRAENEEYRAKQSRARILQFNDELYRGVKHTKESFDDVISEIDNYEDYCDSHPKFPNFKAVAAIDNIKVVYKKRLELADFLK